MTNRTRHINKRLDQKSSPLFQTSSASRRTLSGMPRSMSSRLVGKTLSTYKLHTLLGQGRTGTVYLAKSEACEVPVTVKVYHSLYHSEVHQSQIEEAHERAILFEKSDMAKLIDIETLEDGTFFSIREYVQGTHILDYCNRNKLSTQQRLSLFLKVCDKVRLIHKKGVFLGHLKPENILITEEGLPRLLNFSLNIAPSTDIANPHHLPYHISPEQMRRQKINESTDIYALGTILYQLLTGHPPYHFPSREAWSLRWIVSYRKPKKPSQIVRFGRKSLRKGHANPNTFGESLHEDLDSIVLKMLQKNHWNRYQTVNQLSADITKHLEGAPLKAKPGMVTAMGKLFRKTLSPANSFES